ncbi:MAG: hypothetical protein AB9891_02490 [Anaerolineaceae bacterium]
MFKSIYQFLRSHKAVLAQIALVILFIGALAWGASISTGSQNATLLAEDNELVEENVPPPDENVPTPDSGNPPLASPAVATTPVEFTPNQNETEGIIFAGVMLVLIIVVGTLGVIKQPK